ncbi:nuclear transport factor 2 family protein [Desulfobacterota bacterium AH_259_B03_O07]|nr:nuclear transport factor 2 family protein [Desulfobacterota bacterium AH_259_B03_O07]
MSRIKMIWVSRVSIITAVFLLINIQISYSSDSKKEVVQAAEQFYAALNSMFKGDLDPMIEVWSHADDVTYMGPAGGLLVGWEEVRKSWGEQAKLKLGGKVEPEDMHVIAGDKIGITVNFERGTSYINGKPEKVNIRATNVFRRENGKWKMIGHHTDILPWLKKAQGGE